MYIRNVQVDYINELSTLAYIKYREQSSDHLRQ